MPDGILSIFFRQPIRTIEHHYHTYGNLSGAVNAVDPSQPDFIFAFGPKYNRQVLSNPSTFHSSAMLDIDHPAVQRLSNGLTFMNGDEHFSKRQLMMPVFHRQYIEAYHEDMVTLTDAMLKRWRHNDTIDVVREAHTLTAKIAIKTLFGVDGQEHDGTHLSQQIDQWIRLATSPLLRVFPFNIPGTPYAKIQSLSTRLDQEFRNIIQRKRQNVATYKDVLSLLLQAKDDSGQQMTDDEAIGQVNVLFLAGHETSANAIAWTLFLLSQHPVHLQNVLDELGQQLKGDAPTITQLQELPLLERTIKESMRILPPVVWIQRVATEDFSMDAYQFKAGSTIILSHFMTHHMADIYPNPKRFDPSRWEHPIRDPYNYMAFSVGPRMCIGSTFAMMEMKIVLAMILQRFALTVPDGTEIQRKVTVTLSPKSLPMTVRPIHSPFIKTNIVGDIRELVNLNYS